MLLRLSDRVTSAACESRGAGVFAGQLPGTLVNRSGHLIVAGIVRVRVRVRVRARVVSAGRDVVVGPGDRGFRGSVIRASGVRTRVVPACRDVLVGARDSGLRGSVIRASGVVRATRSR